MPERKLQPGDAYLIHPDPSVRARCRQALAHLKIGIAEFATAADALAATTTTPGKVLTRRERQVLDSIMAGKSNRETAEDLGISAKTVELHRANLMTKMGARNLVALTQAVLSTPSRNMARDAGE